MMSSKGRWFVGALIGLSVPLSLLAADSKPQPAPRPRRPWRS